MEGDCSKKRRKIAIITVAACSAMMMSTDVNKRRNRKIWVRKWLSERREKSEYDLLLRLEDQESFRRYLRMNTATFQELMRLVGPKITKKTTNMREPIPAEAKLAMLRFLTMGESFESQQFHSCYDNWSIYTCCV